MQGEKTSLIRIETNQPLCQQDMKACRPTCTAYPITYSLTFSAIHMLLAVFIAGLSYGWQEARFRYDNVCSFNETCSITFNITYTIPAPVYVYYELFNFSQNHFRFRTSIDYSQLHGSYVTDGSDCSPRATSDNNDQILAPCGLRAYYTWTDNYKFPESFNVTSKGLTWSHEIGYLYHSLSNNYTDEQRWLRGIPGYEDETESDKFAIWMRTSPRPHFRKLVAILNNDLTAGQHQIDIDVNYNSQTYNGMRYLVFNRLSKAGGRNFTLTAINVCLGFIYVIGSIASHCLISSKTKNKYSHVSRTTLIDEPLLSN